ncbi:MAG: hypothetical protein AUI10_06115 [Actinobacteria bacterium 13_2_20CM_2_72_6]|nr:MAG: hypothetical protein AUI10_06115 [Actinobacteria bacterium 13_2_20CM_2_72_6]
MLLGAGGLLGGGVLGERRPTPPVPVPAAPAPASSAPAPTPAPTPAACAPGIDSTVSAPDPSAPGGRRTVRVHRPAGPDRADLPVLYVLHGYPADPAGLVQGSLPRILDAQMCRTGRPFVVAVPDGRAGGLDTEWGDDARGRFAIETFVTQRAVALVEGDQRRPAPLRAIAGFSMGGYGAAAIALRHPDEYRQVASFGGYYRTDDPDGIFGRQPGAHAPDRLLDAAGGQRYFLVEGTDEHTRLRVGGIRGEADRFASALRGRQVTVSVTHPPGGHADDCWYPQLGPMVDFLDAGWPT